MSIESEITRLQSAKEAIKASIVAKGVEIADTATLDAYADKVKEIDDHMAVLKAILEGGENVVIPEGVTAIMDYAFYYNTKVKSITIPSSVTSIGSYAFQNCTSLTSITIPSSVTSIGSYAFSSCSSLTSVTIPSSVTSMGNYAFRDCIKLNNVVFENGLIVIGTTAFYNCPYIESIIIPESVANIGAGAFMSCVRLGIIYCYPTTPPTLANKNIFISTLSSLKIYVPKASITAYKTTTNWDSWADYIEAMPEE